MDTVSGGNASALTDVQQTLAELQAQMPEVATAAMLKELDSRLIALVDTASKSAADVASMVDGKADKAELAAATATLAELQEMQQVVSELQAHRAADRSAERLEHLETNAALKAEASEVDKLAAAVDSMRHSLKNVTGSEQMAEVQQKLEALAAEVASQKRSTAASSAVQGLEDKVAALQTELQTLAKQEELAQLKVPVASIPPNCTWHATLHLSLARYRLITMHPNLHQDMSLDKGRTVKQPPDRSHVMGL